MKGKGHPGRQLAFAGAGVLLAAADTYVVVVALPEIMSGVGVGIGHLQRAAPVVSGFLLGYVAMLPLIGRLADEMGQRPVLVGCLGTFAAGSVVTATARSLPVLVAGRAIQGLGGGGLVPVTLAIVAAGWPPERRGLPFGVVGALQELGSVVGPLYGAAIVALAGWRWIFWLNLPLAAAVAVGFASAAAPDKPDRAARRDVVSGVAAAGGTARRDVVGALLLAAGAAVSVLALAAPAPLATGVTTGRLYAPLAGGPTWSTLTTPIAFAGAGLLSAFCAWEVAAAGRVRPLVSLRALPGALRRCDLPGALLVAGVLSCVVIAFATTDARRQVVASSTPVLAPVAVALACGLAWRQRRARRPLLAPELARERSAWAALAVNFFAGAALVAALVGVPLFARATVDPGSQLAAALVLLRLLAAVPVGALAGGLACRDPRRAATVATAGMALAAAGLAALSTWSASALGPGGAAADVELVVCGLGLGLAIAPVTFAVLAAVPARAHALAASMTVVSRTVGMLVGVSALSAIALHRFYVAEARIPSPLVSCPTNPGSCPPYEAATSAAVLSELHTIFFGAALCAAAAAALSPLLRAPTSSGTGRPPWRALRRASARSGAR